MQEHDRGALARLDDMNSPTASGLDQSTIGPRGTDHPPVDVEHLIGACSGWFPACMIFERVLIAP